MKTSLSNVIPRPPDFPQLVVMHLTPMQQQLYIYLHLHESGDCEPYKQLSWQLTCVKLTNYINYEEHGVMGMQLNPPLYAPRWHYLQNLDFTSFTESNMAYIYNALAYSQACVNFAAIHHLGFSSSVWWHMAGWCRFQWGSQWSQHTLLSLRPKLSSSLQKSMIVGLVKRTNIYHDIVHADNMCYALYVHGPQHIHGQYTMVM